MQPKDNTSPPPNSGEVQGEGDYKAARRYDKAAEEFAKSGKVDEAARDAAPDDAGEAEDLKRAEREGLSHSKGEDPAVRRSSSDKKG